MAEMLFYHLERDPLERVLPSLLEKSLARDWRCLVQCGTDARAKAIDSMLWTYRDESFLPHGLAGNERAHRQPILITTQPDNINGAQAWFLVDGAKPEHAGDFERIVFMFDGHDDNAVSDARGVWRWAREADLTVTYWQQQDDGRWQKRG